MSVTFAREYVRRMRSLGIRVDEHAGCYSRGNGQTSAYRGPLTHHTGASFDGGFSVLLHGRSDLPGPLCNVCTWADGHQTLIAAHPANHAGAAGGSWARPYPDTRLFNRMVWGNEIMYPGSQPMTPEQYRTALIGAGVAVMIAHGLTTLDELARHLEWARLHGETSVSGKWDAGYAPGRMIDRHQFRRDIVPAMRAALPEEDIMASLDDLRRALREEVMWAPRPRQGDSQDPNTTISLASMLSWWDHAMVLDRQATIDAEKRIMARLDEIEARLDAGGGESPKAT